MGHNVTLYRFQALGVGDNSWLVSQSHCPGVGEEDRVEEPSRLLWIGKASVTFPGRDHLYPMHSTGSWGLAGVGGWGGGALAFAMDWEGLRYFSWERPPLPYAYSQFLAPGVWLGVGWGAFGYELRLEA